MRIFSRLQYVSQGRTAREQECNISRSLDAGADWVQLRWKGAAEPELTILAEKVLRRCRSYKAICIINDSAAVAKKVDADGVHLGLTDGSIAEARSILGHERIIGGTSNTFEEVLQRVRDGCDYIGLGPFRFTDTKQNLSPVLGIKGYENIIKELYQKELPVPPIYAIGGIGPADVDDLIQTGVHGLAISAAITGRPNLIAAIKSKLQ